MNESLNKIILIEGKNYFDLFEIPFEFEIEFNKLEIFFIKILGENHPDRFANYDDYIKEIALKNSMLINHAYKTLKSSILRMEYMLNMLGIDFKNKQSIDDVFLEESFNLRLEISTTNRIEDLQKIHLQLEENKQLYQKAIAKIFAEKLYSEVIEVYVKLKFVHKMIEEIEQKIESLEFENEII